MEYFIKLSIDGLLELQQELRELNDTKDKITDDELISKHRYNSEFFEEIHYDIEYKLFGDDDDDDDDDDDV